MTLMRTADRTGDARVRAFAWLGCTMTVVTAFVSVVFFAGWRAVEQNDPNVLFREVVIGTAILTPIVLVLLGLTAWNGYRSTVLARG